MGSKNNVLVHKDINYNLNAIKTRLGNLTVVK